MPKITFMGAGSTVFAKNVLGDSMVTPALAESTIALYDIDPQRLEESYLMLTAISNNLGNKARIEKYCGVENRKDALRGANYVVNAACARPSPIRWASAASSARCVPFPS